MAKARVSSPAVQESKASTAVAVAGPADQIARNRAAAIIDASTVPSAPVGVQIVEIDVRRQQIDWVDEENVAELKHAAQELHDNAATITKDLGDLAPDVTGLDALLSRVEGLEATLSALKLAADATAQQLEIALSDTSTIVKQAGREQAHRVARLPALAQRYEKVARYHSAHGRSVAEGRAKARAAKSEDPAP